MQVLSQNRAPVFELEEKSARALRLFLWGKVARQEEDLRRRHYWHARERAGLDAAKLHQAAEWHLEDSIPTRAGSSLSLLEEEVERADGPTSSQ
jgi:hypothetical protein